MKSMSLHSSRVYHHHHGHQNPRTFLALHSKKTSNDHFSPHLQQTPRAILIETNRTNKPGQEVLLSHRPNAIGIIGGSSAISTLIFLERLVWWGSRRGKTCPPFVLCSDSSSSSGFVEGLKRKREFLEGSGAGCVVMPCHVAHMWHAEVAEECCVPLLHVGECVARELSEAKMRPLEVGGNVKVGILALDQALVHVIYQAKLENKGLEVVLPDKATMEHIVVPSVEALRNGDVKGAQNLVKIAVHILLMRGSNTVIIASDELRGLIAHDDPLLKKCTDPIDVLARSTITWAKSKEHLKV